MRHYVKHVRFSLAIRYYYINMHNILISNMRKSTCGLTNPYRYIATVSSRWYYHTDNNRSTLVSDNDLEVPFTMIKHNTVINVRKRAALDIVFHGTKFILIEFSLAVFLCGAVSVLIFHGANHSPFMVILGSF
jgi:hypothetical protein